MVRIFSGWAALTCNFCWKRTFSAPLSTAGLSARSDIKLCVNILGENEQIRTRDSHSRTRIMKYRGAIPDLALLNKYRGGHLNQRSENQQAEQYKYAGEVGMTFEIAIP